MKQKKKLNIDFEEAFPGKEIQILGTTVSINPLGLKDMSILFRKLRSLQPEFIEAGIDWENYATKEKLIALLDIVMDKMPDIVSDSSGIELSDIEQLPIDEQIKIITAVIEVNIRAKDTLKKNFMGLTDLLKTMTPLDLEK